MELTTLSLEKQISSAYENIENAAKNKKLSVELPDVEGLEQAITASGFVANTLALFPELLITIRNLQRSPLPSLIYPAPTAESLESKTIEQVACELTKYRKMNACIIAFYDVLNIQDTKQTLKLLSELADWCIRLAAAWAQNKANFTYGKSLDAESRTQEFTILTLGKLGGEELNFSSDIDIMLCYPQSTRFVATNAKFSEEQMYSKAAQMFIQALSNTNIYGFCYRVDLRLRPFGDSGPLIMSFNAVEEYYQRYGREWERYALIKARPISKDNNDANNIMTRLRPFIYRKYIDFSVFESLREMRELIESEVKKNDEQDNIKIGKGGIRQIEFLSQTFQLVRGGRQPIFQQRKLSTALRVVKDHDYISQKDYESLINAYYFLRKLENSIQMLHEQQTHNLPKNITDQERILVSMQENSFQLLKDKLKSETVLVNQIYNKINYSDYQDTSLTNKMPASYIWDNLANVDEVTKRLQSYNLKFDEANSIYKLINKFSLGIHSKKRTEKSMRRINKLVPICIDACLKTEKPEFILNRILQLITAINKRSLYISLLLENPQVLANVVALCVKSEWLHNELCRHPILLDELLKSSGSEKMTFSTLSKEIDNRLFWIGHEDLEQQMEVLRQFKIVNVFRVAAANVLGQLTLKRVSDKLTDIATIVLNTVTNIAWNQVAAKHSTGSHDSYSQNNFMILGYGKLGGLELSYTSDLDLVFLFSDEQEFINIGKKSIQSSEFYVRLVQRIFHILNTTTISGPLYNIDTRLRPMGKAGLIASSLSTFAEYQRNDAWTFEHQALVRARVIVGNNNITTKFNSLRREILAKPRNKYQLKTDIATMRDKIKNTKNSKEIQQLLKNNITDIEFIVQYYILRWSKENPILLENTDNLRIIDSLVACAILHSRTAKILKENYLYLREQVHMNNLYSLKKEEKSIQEELNHRNIIIESIWQNIFAGYCKKMLSKNI